MLFKSTCKRRFPKITRSIVRLGCSDTVGFDSPPSLPGRRRDAVACRVAPRAPRSAGLSTRAFASHLAAAASSRPALSPAAPHEARAPSSLTAAPCVRVTSDLSLLNLWSDLSLFLIWCIGSTDTCLFRGQRVCPVHASLAPHPRCLCWSFLIASAKWKTPQVSVCGPLCLHASSHRGPDSK